MNKLAIFCFSLLVLEMAIVVSQENPYDTLVKIRQICQNELRLSPSELDQAYDDPLTEPDCYVHCVFKATGVMMYEDDCDRLLPWTWVYHDKRVQKALKTALLKCSNVLEKCENITCEKSPQIVQCVKETVPEEVYERLGIFKSVPSSVMQIRKK